MRRFWKFGLVCAVLIVATAGWATDLYVPGTYSTIQAAIDAAAPSGDVIYVAAGNYDEMLNANKSVTLRGANWGVHPAVGTHPTEVVGTRGAETNLTHNGLYAINPSADNITVDGFVFNGTGARIIDTYANANNFHLTNCIFVATSCASGSTGRIQLGGGSHTNCLLDFNDLGHLGDHLFYAGGGPFDGLTFQYNDIIAANDLIFWAATPLVGGVFSYNDVDGTIGTPGTGFCTINIGQAGNMVINGNYFHDLQYTAMQVGIIGGSITNNTFDNIYPYPGLGADAIQLWGGQWGTAVSSNVTITGNVVNFNDIPAATVPTHGVRLRVCESGSCPGIDGSTIHINNNQFLNGGVRTDAYALRHQGNAATTVDAECNYWTAMDEPTILSKIQGLADVNPWSDSGMNCPPLPTPVHNITQSTNYTTIGAAVAAAAPGNIIEVDPGTYPEGIITIPVSLTIRASNNASPPTITPTAGGEAWFTVNAGANVDFSYLNFNGSGQLIHYGIQYLGTGTVDHCAFSYIDQGAASYVGTGVDGKGSALTVQNSTFDHMRRIGVHYDGTGTVTIRGNTYTGKGAGDHLDYAFVIGHISSVTYPVALIENNDVSQCVGVALSDGSGSAGIYCYSDPSHVTFTLHGNLSHDNSVGVYVDDPWSLNYGSAATVTSNNLADNVAYAMWSQRADNLVQATANWWGDVNGPIYTPASSVPAAPQREGLTARRNNQPLDGERDARGNLHYSPWVASSGNDLDANPANGWQPDLSVVGVSTNGTIQEGIDLVSGSTVNVYPGTYPETPSTSGKHGLTLQGSDPLNRPNITGGLNGQGTDNLTLQDLIVTGDASGAVVRASNSTGTNFTMNRVRVDGQNTSGRMGIAGNHLNGNVSITYCEIVNVNFWAVVDTRPGSGGACSGSLLGTCVFSNNTLDNNKGHTNFRGTLGAETPSVTISNNTVTNVGSPDNNSAAVFKVFYATNVVFSGNNISDVGFMQSAGTWPTEAHYGAALMPRNVANLTCTGNTFTNCNQGIAFEPRNANTTCGATTYADGVLAGGTIGNSTFSGCTYGVYVPANLHPTSNFAGLAVENNTFSGSGQGVHNGYTSGTLDAECNWWGTLNYASILAKTYGLVDFENWNDATLTNCTYNNANTYDVTLSFDDAYVGCSGGASCTDAVLKVAFDRANVYGTDLVITLPSGIVANWTGDNYQVVPPSPSTNMYLINAAGGGTSTITLDVAWNPPYSTGAPGQYIAWLPVRNTGASNGTYAVAIASYHYWDAGGDHTTGLDFSLPSIYVDCVAPVGTALTGGAGEGSCAGYNDATAFTDALSAVVGTSVSALTSAVISLNGGAFTYNVPLADGTWPTAANVATVWGNMTQGCNTFALTVTDAACNSTTTADVTVIKDTVAPVFTPSSYFTQGIPCYNNIPSDPNYGATRLDTELDMSVDPYTSCQTSGFTLMFTMGANNFTPIANAAVTNYPYTPLTSALWAFITANITPPTYSGNVTVNWTLTDCLGNPTTGSFTFCVDFAPPSNTFTVFDARPTYGGVWLKWNWTYDASQATAMEIYRKGEGDYPVYAGDLSMSDANYEKVHSSLAGWTLAAAQAGPNNTAALYTGGGNIHYTDGVLGTYWKDAIGTDGAPLRDIYRYVTFVRDAAGNWSQVGSYTLLTNADRSTNYWLGDYSFHVTTPIPNPPPYGIVDGVDLGLLSQHYFVSATGWEFLDIGPENHENAYGKGIPNNLDNFINFQDLMPFSYNYGVVGASSFHMPVPTRGNFEQLDAMPSIAVTRSTDAPIEAGTEFTVNVALTGNSSNATKIAEAQIEYDPMVLEFVEATAAGAPVFDGVPFSAARAVEGTSNTIGVVSAAIGEIAVLNGDFTMATLTFRWKSDNVPSTSLNVTSVQMADAYGHVISSEGSVFGFGATGIIPTSYALYQNYPNPFNPTTLIRYDLPEDANVRLVIYNVMGQEVRTLVNGTMPAGAHHITWDGLSNGGQAVGTGLYVYRISANHFSATHKMLLTR